MMKYSEAMEYMEKVNHLGSSLGLASIKELCRRLGNPQDLCQFIHIAGTNGKGSALAYISSVLTTAGYHTGRYSSPAVFDYRERFQIDGKMISKQAFAGYLAQVSEKADAMEAEGLPHPTAFEIETAVAFLFFADHKCDIVVLETGMGGLLDATNLITTTLVCVFASVSMDHMQFLGKTLSEIAVQKAGIIKPGSVVVSMSQKPEVMEVIKNRCGQLHTKLVVADSAKARDIRYGMEKQNFSYGDYRNLRISLGGSFQIENAVLSLCVLQELGNLGFPVSEAQIREGLAAACWPGRFTVLSKKPLFIVDGAHNAEAAEKLAHSIELYVHGKRKIFIMGILRDKEYPKIIQSTAPLAQQVITVAAPGNARAMSAYDLAREVREYQPNVTAADSLEEAVEMAYLLADSQTVIVSFGSLSYLGKLTEIVRSRSKNTAEKKAEHKRSQDMKK